MADKIIRVENISKNFGGIKALCNVATEVEKGTIHAIIGPNGSGKTTLINVITGFYKPDGGSVYFKNEAISGLAPHEVAAKGLGRTFQNLRLFNSMTAFENIQTALNLKLDEPLFQIMLHTGKIRAAEASTAADVDAILERLGITELRNKPVAALPYGKRRMVEIARALVLQPEILFLDEPVAGMNSTESVELIEKVRKIVDEDRITVILIEHDMRTVMTYSDEITVLDHGEVIARGVPADIQKNEKVITAYLGESRELKKKTAKEDETNG